VGAVTSRIREVVSGQLSVVSPTMDAVEVAAIVEAERARQAQRQRAAEAAGGAFDPILARWVAARAEAQRHRGTLAQSQARDGQQLLLPLSPIGDTPAPMPSP